MVQQYFRLLVLDPSLIPGDVTTTRDLSRLCRSRRWLRGGGLTGMRLPAGLRNSLGTEGPLSWRLPYNTVLLVYSGSTL